MCRGQRGGRILNLEFTGEPDLQIQESNAVHLEVKAASRRCHTFAQYLKRYPKKISSRFFLPKPLLDLAASVTRLPRANKLAISAHDCDLFTGNRPKRLS